MLSALLLIAALPAAEAANTITVTGEGSASRSGEKLAMTTTISASAKLAGDAITKQKSFRQQFDEAIEAIGVDGLQIRSQGVSVATSTVSPQQRQMMQMNGQKLPSSGLTVSESIIVEFAAPPSDDDTLQTLRQLLDTASDLDVQFVQSENNQLVRPIVADIEQLRAEAYEKALRDARAKADRLAGLISRKIARVQTVSIRSTSNRPSAGSNLGTMSPYQFMMFVEQFEMGETVESSAASGSLSTHTENASLNVVYELE